MQGNDSTDDERRAYRAHHLRAYVDGEEHWQVDPSIGVCKLFSLPLSASSMEIFGDDDGDLLLAVFPLPEPACIEADRVHQLSVPLEGGQTIAVEISLAYGTSGEVSHYVIQKAYL